MVIVFDAAGVFIGGALVVWLIYDLVVQTRREWRKIKENDKTWKRWRDRVALAQGAQNYDETVRLLRLSDDDIRKGNF